MPKYQFFKLEQTEGNEYQWLAMAEDTFLAQKEQLLRRGFEVVGDTIYAENEQDAIAKFNSGMIYPLDEYNTSTPIGGLIYAAKGLVEALQDRFRDKTDTATSSIESKHSTTK